MKLVVANKTWADLDHALEQVLQRFGPEPALRVERDVLAALKLIQKFPHGGQVDPWLEHLGLEHRRVIVGPLKIIYRIDGDALYVPEIFDTRHDPKKMTG